MAGLYKSTRVRFNLLRIYYLATPIFFILYHYFDLNIRLTIPGVPAGWLYVYYLVCFIAGFTVFRNIMAGAIFALVESAMNIFLLLLGVWLPLIYFDSYPAGDGGFRFGVPELVHFFIAASILLLGFYSNPLIRKE